MTRCGYVLATASCTDQNHYIRYVHTYYCAGAVRRVFLLLAFALWLLVLFYCLSEVAETFLVPAVEVLSSTLCLQ